MLRAEVWLTTTLIALGIIGGLIYNWPRQERSAQSVQAAQVREDEPSAEALQPAVAPLKIANSNALDDLSVPELEPAHVEQGDNFLIIGNYVGAYRAYLKANNQAPGKPSSLLLIKLGISSEQAGYLDQAEKFYRQAIQFSTNRENDRLLGLSGLSRVWQAQNRLDESLELLTELFLRYGSSERIPEEIWMQIGYQLSTVIQRQFLLVQPTSYGDVHHTEFLWSEPNIQAVISLDDEKTTVDDVPSLRDDSIQLEILQRPSEDINLIAVDISTTVVPISRVIDAFARDANLSFEMTTKARSAIVGRSTKLSVHGLSLALILDNLISPLGLIWEQVADQVQIKHLEEMPEKVVSFRFQQANRMLRWIELSFPQNPRRNSSLLHRGNLSLMADDFDAAGARYQELLQINPNGELSAKLSFNLAKLDLAIGRREQAVERLFFSVDQTLDHQLQSASYGWIGRTELEKGNLQQAIYASSRGVSLAIDPTIRQDNVMTLAKSYLLENDPFSANKVLFDHAPNIVDENAQRLAAVLSAYARFLGTTESLGLRNEGERMIIALAAIESGDLIGFVDELLVGRAFFEVGFTTRSTELMQLALNHATQEEWQRRIAFELAMHRLRSGDTELAVGIFTEVAGDLKDAVGIRAQLKLAEISLNLKQAERCLLLCKQLWQMPLSDAQKNETLDMMGHAYQRLGRPHAAAVCFAGMVPHDEAEMPKPDSIEVKPTIKTSSYADQGGWLKN